MIANEWRLTAEGWLAAAGALPWRLSPSPNCDERPDADDITLLIVHNISLPPGQFGGDAIEALFTNRLDPNRHPFFAEVAALRVAAHFLIRRDGEIIQFVASHQRAWHAGVSEWKGRERCNDFSLGIELEGTDFEPFTDVQYHQLAGLAALLSRQHALVDFAGHSDVAPGRKTDPGPYFDWARFHQLLAAARQPST